MTIHTALRPAAAALVAALSLSACVASEGGKTDMESLLAGAPMGWAERAEGAEWTVEAMEAVAAKDDVLADVVPADIATWCPGYADASISERRAFWVGLMSAVSYHESRFTPEVTGGGGRYIGLMQISPITAKGHGCDATSVSALKDGGENLSCAVEIFAEKVAADGMVAGNGKKGLGRDWGPFRKSKARAQMAEWTSSQPYCQKA